MIVCEVLDRNNNYIIIFFMWGFDVVYCNFSFFCSVGRFLFSFFFLFFFFFFIEMHLMISSGVHNFAHLYIR